VFKDDASVVDYGTGEVARKATTSKYYKDKLKSTITTKCHLNDYLGSLSNLSYEDIAGIKFPIIQIMGLSVHISVMQLKGKGVYTVEKVCSFCFPKSLYEIKAGKIEKLIDGLVVIEVSSDMVKFFLLFFNSLRYFQELVEELQRMFYEGQNDDEDEMERVADEGKKKKKKDDWRTEVVWDEEAEEDDEDEDEDEEDGGEDEGEVEVEDECEGEGEGEEYN
jgi:hypothetical protein